MRQAELEYKRVYEYANRYLENSSHDRLSSSRNYAVFMGTELGRTCEGFLILEENFVRASCDRQPPIDSLMLDVVMMSRETLESWFPPYAHYQL